MFGSLIVGLQFLKPEFMQILSKGNFERLIFLYICLLVGRFISITIFMPKLKNTGYGLEWK